MNTSALLTHVRDDMKAFLEPQQGRVYLAQDPLHALEILAASPTAYFAVLLDKGDDPDQQGPVIWLNSKFALYVAQNRGLQVDESEKLLSLSARCEQVRDRVLSKQYGDDTEGSPKYQGRALVTLPDGMPLAAYELNFSFRLAGSNLTYRS